MIPAPRHSGEHGPDAAPPRQMTSTELFDRIPQQRRASVSVDTPLVSQTLPNPALVAGLAPREPRRFIGPPAVLGGAVAAVAVTLVLIMVLGASA